MKMRSILRNRASTLVVALLLIATLGVTIAGYYRGLVPKFRGTHQGVSWHEALHGADAGVDLAIASLNNWAATGAIPDAYPWSTNGWTATDATYGMNGERTLAAGSLANLGGPNRTRITRLAVDVYTRETIGSTPSYTPWYRVRSTARADLPGKYVPQDSRDVEVRRMKLGAKTSGGADDPHVTRTIEVVLRPKYRFNRAITSVNDMSLGNSANWVVDSFDSQDTSKSNPGTTAGGLYPAGTPSKIQSNGSIATAKQNPEATPYGPLISGNGAVIRGDVQTNGGDDPSTTAFENVSGSSGMDQTRIRSDYDDVIPTPIAPSWASWTYQGVGRTTFVTGTQAAPARYIITGNQGSFAVVPPVSGTGYVEIIITGSLATGNGASAGITIPANVFATLWVEGNIDFGNGSINTNAASSKVASRLTINGVSTAANATFSAQGNATQALTFNGPNYTATLSGTVETTGAFIVRNFSINGGGNGGFHYDEALGRSSGVAGWEVASYFEDSRGDL